MEIQLTEQDQDNIKSLTDMIKSCYTYGGAEKGSYNYERYIKPYESKLSKLLFEITYTTIMQELKNYKVVVNVYEDSEGLNYNRLEKID